ncbi:MAG: chloride channel protein [Faecalimonas sp.]|nr:chloride channel protein [Faecalimonas sp.]
MKNFIKIPLKGLLQFLCKVVIASSAGLIIGLVGVAFVKGLSFVTGMRNAHPYLILALPLAGLVIVALYKLCKYENDPGTNLVISTIHSKTEIPFRMAPLIFVSTLLTHMFGGSAGREGAALQLGGSIGNQLGRCLKLQEEDRRTMVMCGMSAAFSSIFGTPMAAVIFALEVNSVGIMYYSALVPCVFASLVASSVANYFGVGVEAFGTVENVPFAFVPVLKMMLLGILCALLSVAFCKLLHLTADWYKKLLKNAYLRVAVAGVILVALTALLGTSAYSGAGANLIEEAIAGEAPPAAFLLKMLFTALTLGAGFKGGEIVPSFAIGATFGCLFGTIFGLPPSLCAAVAMISMFCGVTNTPIASMIIGFELFGFDIMKYLLIGVCISYALSGYYSLYHEQRIVYSKSSLKYKNQYGK